MIEAYRSWPSGGRAVPPKPTNMPNRKPSPASDTELLDWPTQVAVDILAQVAERRLGRASPAAQELALLKREPTKFRYDRTAQVFDRLSVDTRRKLQGDAGTVAKRGGTKIKNAAEHLPGLLRTIAAHRRAK
jgi:hypothetical protein